jgi:hypothetical protein
MIIRPFDSWQYPTWELGPSSDRSHLPHVLYAMKGHLVVPTVHFGDFYSICLLIYQIMFCCRYGRLVSVGFILLSF